MNQIIATNVAQNEFSSEIVGLLAKDIQGRGSKLLPVFNLKPKELALLNGTSIKGVSEAEAVEAKAKLIATNDDAFGYDYYRSVQMAAIEGIQAETVFVNMVRNKVPADTSHPWYKMVLQWDRPDLMRDAHNTGSTQTAGNKDTPQKIKDYLDLPFQLSHAGNIDPATLAQSRAAGAPIDVDFAREGGKAIGRLMENNALGVGTSGAKYYGAQSNYGVYDDPNNATGTLQVAWDSLTTPYKKVKDVAAMKADLVNKGFPSAGPYAVTVGADYSESLDDLINPQANNVFTRELLLKMQGIVSVEASAYAPTGKVSLTYLGSIKPIQQLDITVVPYGGYGNSDWGTQNWVFFSKMNIQHKVDFNGQFGQAVYSAP